MPGLEACIFIFVEISSSWKDGIIIALDYRQITTNQGIKHVAYYPKNQARCIYIDNNTVWDSSENRLQGLEPLYSGNQPNK